MTFEHSDLRDLNPTRVLVCGDWHGDLRAAKAAINLAKTVCAGALLHVGDLNWRWNGDHPKTFDLPLNEELTKAGIPMIWADGNHDRHDLLANMPVRDDGFVQCASNLFWSPRGNRWNWAGRDFGTLGGAYSIDRKTRREGVDVWADLEEVTLADVDRLGNESLDVLLTHEAPEGVYLSSDMHLLGHVERAANMSRILLRMAVEATIPELVFSGHWHQRRTSNLHLEYGMSVVEVLNMNGSAGNAVILDVESLTVSEPDPGWHQWTRKAERRRISIEARRKHHKHNALPSQ